MKGNVIRARENITPAFLALAALTMVLLTPTFITGASGDAPTSQGERWYDPANWFTKGGTIPHESEWYQYTYGQVPTHSKQRARPYYAPMEEEMPPRHPQMEQYEGEILDVRTARLRNAPLQVFARVRLDGDVTTAVDLGPRSQLNFIDLGALRGKRVAILAHPAWVEGEKALVVHQIQLYGITTRIYWSLPTP